MTASKPKGRIIGTGSSAPIKVLSNKDLEHIVDTTDEWIVRRTGIKERRISSKHRAENTSEMATQAALNALEMACAVPADLDMIIVGTVTPDQQFPSAGCSIQEKLDAKNAAAFDVSAGCAGFLYALSMADNAIRSGTVNNALVIGVERLSSILNWKDRSTCVLLGDGAGAVVLSSNTVRGGVLSTHLKSDGHYGDLLQSYYGTTIIPDILEELDVKPYRLSMEGNRLFKKAIGCLSEISLEALQHNGLTSEDIKLVVPHQANLRIISGMAKNLGIPMEKVFTNVHKYGNTSSASIPIALDEANRSGLLHKGDNVLLVSFGAGLTWAASIVQWSI